jgi:hypothetical protein
MTVWRPPGYFDPLAYKQTIAYGRYSSLHQGHGQSEDRQHEELEKVLKLFGWRLLDQYFDKGVSAGRGKHRVIGVLSRLLKRIHADGAVQQSGIAIDAGLVVPGLVHRGEHGHATVDQAEKQLLRDRQFLAREPVKTFDGQDTRQRYLAAVSC